ncbi:galactokinase [Saccharothrix violaceirubra]|uniref:Galactokinase n=1 Tax=Saccharothrix violaceirubra TaxID=413306 RepID=A0A7W7T5Q8_9PSEU|nr:galactokinase [Saccharothrix violaceirubra]MBB4967041.1 galactokinase [Saccharothrix violaceirubra]
MPNVYAAPGRVNLIGEHTDYSDGFVLPVAIPQVVEVSAVHRDDRAVRVSSAQRPDVVEVHDLVPGAVTGWAAYVVCVVWALREAGYDIGGFDLHVDGRVPQGAGLSSSAALECAAALAVTDLSGVDVSRPELAKIARRAENVFVGVPCGIMDQSISLLAREGHALLLDTRSLRYRHVPFDPDRAGLDLLVVDTDAPHRLVDGEYADRKDACDKAAALLGVPALRDVTHPPDRLPGDLNRRVRHVVTENRRVREVVRLLDAGDIRRIGPLLTASHESLRVDYEVTVPELDVAVDELLGAGALGARMTGGGFGGCVIALCAKDRTDNAVARVTKAFHSRGFRTPTAWTTRASEGARRIG